MSFASPAPALAGFGAAPLSSNGASSGSMASFSVSSGSGVGTSATSVPGDSNSATRGRTLFPYSRNFLAGLRNIATYGATHRTLNANSFKAKYFDGKCEEYFSKLFDGSEKNPQDRQNIIAGRVPGVETIDERRIQSILKFSDEYDLNELTCLDYYIASQRNPILMRNLEVSDPSKQEGFYDLRDPAKVEAAPRDLYSYECKTMLDGLLLLLKMYVSTERLIAEEPVEDDITSEESYMTVLSMGRRLLNDKALCSKLITTMKKRYERIRARNAEGQKGVTAGRDYVVTKLDWKDFEELKKLSICLFYAMENNSAAEKELQPLQELIFLLSKDLTRNNDFLLSVDGNETINAWQSPAHVTLVVLQLTHFQTVDLLTDRCFEATQEAGKSSLESLLFQLAGDLYVESKGLGCHSSYGMALLAYAQFVRDSDPSHRVSNQSPGLDFSELIYQVNEGDACLGTYNYLRLCVLPVLQAQSRDTRDRDTTIGGMKEIHADLFDSYLKILDALASTCSDSYDLVEDSTISDIGNLYAATFAVKPSYAKQFNPNPAIPHGAFDPFIVQMLNHTMRVAGDKLNTVSLHILAGLCGGATEADNVYRLLDSTPQAASPNSIAKLNWTAMFAFVQKCVDYVSKIQDVHEKILISVFTLVATVSSRSVGAGISLLRDYRPIPLLFQLLSVPVSITLKGSIFRALAACARTGVRDAHDEIWHLIESYRLLPTYGIGKDASTAMQASLSASGSVGVSVSNNLTGLRLELEDSESKEGLYSITDGFLQLLDVLLRANVDDQLGSRYRPPGIVVYLEYVIEDVLIKAKDRFFTVGPQGKAQRWRLVARCFKVLISVLQHYSINALDSLQAQKNKGESIDDDTLSALHADFREDSASYTINGTLHHGQPRLKSSGFFVMSLLLSNTSKLRDQLLQVLKECGTPNLLESWERNFEAATKQALKMGEILAQKTKQASFLDTRLGFFGFDGGICDGSYWQGRSVTTAMGLLYECALRERSFVKHFRSTPYLTIMRNEQGRLVSTPITVHNLADLLSVNTTALTSITKLLNISDYYSTSIPSVPIMASKLLKKAAKDLPSAKLLDTIHGQLSHSRNVEGGSISDKFMELQSGCLEALMEGNRLPIMEGYEQGVLPLGCDMNTDVFSLESAPCNPPDAEKVLEEAYYLLEEGPSYESNEFESKAEAVVDFLLTTLSSDKECFSHVLLGLMKNLDETRVNRWDTRLASDNWKRSEIPTNCLEQILFRLEDAADLIEKEPEFACICFELVYRLCVSPITSAIILAYLRKYDVKDANGNTEKLLASCMRQCLDVLRGDPPSPTGESEQKEGPNWSKVKTSRNICTGWLLKICAVELRSLGILRESGSLLPLHLEPYLNLYLEDLTYAGYNMNFLEIILLSACQCEEVVSLDNISPLVSRCLGAASSQYRIGRFNADVPDSAFHTVSGVSSEASGSFTTIEKKGFIKQFFAEVDETEFQDKADEYRQGIQLLVRLNRHYREVAASIHLAEAWKQYTSVFVICHGASIIKRSPGQSSQNLQDFMKSLLLPILRALREHAPTLNLPVLESIASTVFILVRELCRVPLRGIQGTPLSLFSHAILSVEDTTALLDDIIGVILQSVTGFLQPQGESGKFRGFLYSTLSAVLTGLTGFPSSLNSKLELVKDNKYKSEHHGSHERDTQIRMSTMRTLSKHASALTDAMGRDCCSGPLLWRLNSCTALSNVMAIVGQSGMRNVLQTLLSHGYLHQMLSVIDTLNGDDSAALPSPLSSPADDDSSTHAHQHRALRETFISVISLCCHIASTEEGTEALLQSGGILRRLNELQIFRRTPQNLDSLTVFQLQEGCISMWVTQLLPVLRLFRIIAVNSPSRQVLLGLAEFLKHNIESVTFVLRLRLKSLAGLCLAECMTSLLATIASASPAPKHRRGSLSNSTPNETPGNESSHLWESILGEFGNTIISDLCDLLRLIGGDPFPKELARKCGVSSVGAFWSHIVPAASHTEWVEDERRLANTIVYNDEEFKEFPRTWSAFDHMKLDLSLKITSHISALLRLRTHAIIEQGFSGDSIASAEDGTHMRGRTALSAMEPNSVAQAFCQCSALSRKCTGVSGTAGGQLLSHSGEDKAHGSPGAITQGVQSTLLHISENLITCLHDLAMTYGVWKQGVLSAVLTEAQIHGDNRLFINELGRVMRCGGSSLE